MLQFCVEKGQVIFFGPEIFYGCLQVSLSDHADGAGAQKAADLALRGKKLPCWRGWGAAARGGVVYGTRGRTFRRFCRRNSAGLWQRRRGGRGGGGAPPGGGAGPRGSRRLCRRKYGGLRPRRRAVMHAARPRPSLPNSPRLPGLPAPDPLVPGYSAEKKKTWGTVDKPT